MEENKQIAEILERMERNSRRQLRLGRLQCLFSLAAAVFCGASLFLILRLLPQVAQVLPQMEQLLREHSIPVTLLPLQPQEKLPEIYSSLDAFAFPTQRAGESLGLVGLEAMACGVPVICSDFAAPADYVVEGVNGFQFAVGDPQAMAEAIQRCMDTPLETENILATARQYCADEVHKTMKKIITQ